MIRVPEDFDDYPDPTPKRPDDYEPSICPDCNGSGEGMHDGTRCATCKGRGELDYCGEEE